MSELEPRHGLPPEAYAAHGGFDWDFFETHPEMIVPEALNNFHARFPGGVSRLSWQEFVTEDPELATKKLGDRVTSEAKRKKHGAVRLGQTMDEFFQSIDKAAQTVGIDLVEIEREMQEDSKLDEERSTEEKVRRQNQLRTKLIPVYKKLRELGYTHTDLVQ